MTKFVGRGPELDRLLQAARRKSASFIVVKGRRRIGKSRLIEEFARNFDRYYVFSGLPPEPSTTGTSQLTEFSRQMARQFRSPHAQYADWGDALWAVAERVRTGKGQIDYLIQMKFGTLYVCEIKFSKNPIGAAVIAEVEAKIQALSQPRGTSCRPVRIHVNGVTDDVVDSDYFAQIVDMSEMLRPG